MWPLAAFAFYLDLLKECSCISFLFQMQGKSFELAKVLRNWLPILFKSLCWWILWKNPFIFYYTAILITAVAIHHEPLSRDQGLVQSSQSISSNNVKRPNSTWIYISVSLQVLAAFFFSPQLKLWNEMDEVALIPKAVASLFRQRKICRKKKRCEQVTWGFALENQVYWKLEMVVFNHTVRFR